MTVAVRVFERERLGASRAQILSATAHEQLVAVAAAAAISLAAFAGAGRKPPVIAVVALVLVLVVAVPAQPVVRWGAGGRLLRGFLNRYCFEPAFSLWRHYCAGARGWSPGSRPGSSSRRLRTGRPGFSYLLGAYTFAWLAGFVVPFAPSGLGVREATLIALVAPVVGVAPATALTVGCASQTWRVTFSPSELSKPSACS